MYCRDLVVMADGPTGSGKTRPTLEKINALCAKYPGTRALLLRKAKAHAATTIMTTWETQVCTPNDPAARLQSQNYKSPCYRYGNGSYVAVDGMYDGSGYNQAVMGTEWDIIVPDEGTQFSEDDGQRLIGRLNRIAPAPGRIPYNQIVFPCNPEGPQHWLWRWHLSGKLTRIASRLEDNPVFHDGRDWTEQGRKYLEAVSRYTGVMYQRNRLGLWVGAEGMIYADFVEDLHVLRADGKPNARGLSLPKDYADLPRIRAMDFGYNEPFVCGWFAVDGDGRMYLEREMVKREVAPDKLAERVKRMTPTRQRILWTVADHDAGERAIFRDRGVESIRAIKPKAGDAWVSHFEPVWRRLQPGADGRPRLFVLDNSVEMGGGRDPGMDRKPVGFREEVTGYVWEDPREGRAHRERPHQVHDHACDMLRYAVHAVDRHFDASDAKVPVVYERGSVGDMLGLDDEDD
jgi:phage terminase large subunit